MFFRAHVLAAVTHTHTNTVQSLLFGGQKSSSSQSRQQQSSRLQLSSSIVRRCRRLRGLPQSFITIIRRVCLCVMSNPTAQPNDDCGSRHTPKTTADNDVACATDSVVAVVVVVVVYRSSHGAFAPLSTFSRAALDCAGRRRAENGGRSDESLL